MKKIKTDCKFPASSIMNESFGKIDYQDYAKNITKKYRQFIVNGVFYRS